MVDIKIIMATKMVKPYILKDEEVQSLYIEKRKSAVEIGRIFNCDSSTVYNSLKRQNIPRRSHSENMKGKKFSEELKQKLRGRIPWNKGLNKEINQSIKEGTLKSIKAKLQKSHLNKSICKNCKNEFTHYGARTYCSRKCSSTYWKTHVYIQRDFLRHNEKQLSNKEIDNIIKLYSNGCSPVKIAKDKLYSCIVVRRILKENNIPLRNLSESTKLRMKSEDKRNKLRIAHIGKHLSEATKQKLSENHSGSRNHFYGKTHSKETIQKIRLTKIGKTPWNYGKPFLKLDKNPNWHGGLSFEPYGFTFDKSLKTKIRIRDNFTCKECNYTEEQLGYKLSIHHIDYDKQNNHPSNLISLCKNCHMQTNFKREDWKNYFKNKMGESIS